MSFDFLKARNDLLALSPFFPSLPKKLVATLIARTMSDHLQWQTSLKCIVIKLHLTVRFSFLSSAFNKGLHQGESEPLKKKGAWSVDYPGPDILRNIFHSLDVCWILNPCEDNELDEKHPIV